MPEIYLVGGAVRDSLLGKQSKDLDYTYVADDLTSVDAAYTEMKEYMLSEDFSIFLETPDCYTIRAKFPKSSVNANLVGDFVLARKEISYTNDSRKPILLPGTLQDDLTRRDFTINAMAEDSKGNLIDLFNGQNDLKDKLIKTPIDPIKTLLDDSLRVLRALRFSVTLNFTIDKKLMDCIWDNRDYIACKTYKTVSSDRIRQELSKAFKADTYKTLETLKLFPDQLLIEWFGDSNLWLKPTFEK